LTSDPQAHLAGFRAGSVLAGYRLETQVGSGGMAVVFRARDEHLNRLVALKILTPALSSDSEFRARFIAESRAAAAVNDPYIIPVYEAGEADGVLFIAMRFVQGGDLRRVLEREGALPPERVAGFISPVASALDAAHRAGLVHRDVKPANILVDAREDRPDHVYLSDFGVSKAMASAGLTSPGYFVGTPDYSAPEQIEGRPVDGRTDQYALACVAFQLLTGALPYQDDQGTPVLQAHLSAPPPAVTSRMPDLPGAVDRVLARAMAKDPDQRYASCLEFADALSQALGPAPYERQDPATVPGIAQAVTSPSETLTRTDGETLDQRGKRGPWITGWIGRHRVAALAVTCAIVAAAVIPFALQSPGNSPKQVRSSPAARSASPASSPVYSFTAIQLPSPYAGRVVLSLAFSPSGALAIVQGDVCLWDFATKDCTTDYTAGPVFKNGGLVAFSPDGRILAVADVNAKLWNVAAKKQTATFTDPNSAGVDSIAFSPNGQTLALGDGNGNSYLWDIATGKLTATFPDPGATGSVRPVRVAFSPDGKTLAVGDLNGHTHLWDIATGKLTATFNDPGSKGVNAIAFSPNGQTLATGDDNGFTYLWNTTTKKMTALADAGSRGVSAIAFSPNGKTLATGDQNGFSYLWDIPSGQLAATLDAPGSLAINTVAFSHDGKTLATGDENGDLNLWHLTLLLDGRRRSTVMADHPGFSPLCW
jgi:serine/threonine protein kinase